MSRRWAVWDIVTWLRDQEHDLVGVVGRQPDALRQFLAERDALGDVAVPPPLADVVEQHAEHQQIRPLDVVQHAAASDSADCPGASASRFSTASSECWSAVNL